MTPSGKRPLSVTLIAILYIFSGTMGIIYHAPELKNIFSQPDAAWVLLVRLLAIVGGIFTLKGANWARWLLIAWIGYHVYISIFHEISALIMHALLMIITAIALFHRKANVFFSRG